MGYAEEFERWLDDDLETLERCDSTDRTTIESIVTAWARRPARAVAVRAFFANWATAIESGSTPRIDDARKRAEQALRLDDKYRRLRERCDALLGAQRDLPQSILESRAFWETAQRELARVRVPLSAARPSRTNATSRRSHDLSPPPRPRSGFWKRRQRPS